MFEDEKDCYGGTDLLEAGLCAIRLAGACVGVDGQPFPSPTGNPGAEPGGGHEVDARCLLAGLEPAAAAQVPRFPMTLQGGGGE